MSSAAKRRYTVRKQSSGWTASESYYVYDLVKRGRVSVHAQMHRSAAQSDADQLEVLAMVKPYDEDPRPFAERLAEATHRFVAGQHSRS